MPRRTSAPGKEKRSTRKIDRTIVIALITLAGTIFTAILASPVLIELIKRTPVPTIELTETPFLSSNQSQILSSTLPVTPSSTNLSSSTQTTSTGLTPNPPVTPGSNIFLVSLPTGEEVRLTTITIGIYLQGTYGPALNGSATVPLESGSEISFDYINRVEFGDKTAYPRPVIIRLTDKTELKSNLGYTAVTLRGKTAFGPFEKPISDIEAITVHRVSTPSSMPSALPAGLVATIYDTNGNNSQISNLGFVFFQSPVMYGFGTPQCDAWSYGYLPTQEGFKIDFLVLKEIEFIHDDELNPILVRIKTRDEQTATYHMAAIFGNGDLALPCKEMSGWWLRGEIALGSFSVPIHSISKVVFD